MFTSAEIKKFAIDYGFADADGNITDPNGLYEAAKQYGVSASSIGQAFGIPTAQVNSWLQSNQKTPLEGDETVSALLSKDRTYGTEVGSVPTPDGMGWQPAMQPPAGIYGGTRINTMDTPDDQRAWNSALENQANQRSHYAMRIAGLTGSDNEMGMGNDLSNLMNAAAGATGGATEQNRYAQAMPAANKYLLARDVLEGRITGEQAEALMKRDELQGQLEQARADLARAVQTDHKAAIDLQTTRVKGLEQSLADPRYDKVPKSTEGLLYGSNPSAADVVKAGGVWGLQAPQAAQQGAQQPAQQATQQVAQSGLLAGPQQAPQQPAQQAAQSGVLAGQQQQEQQPAVKKKATAATNGTAGEVNPYLQQGQPMAATPGPFQAAQTQWQQAGMVNPYTPATMNAAQMNPTTASGPGDFQTAVSFGAPATPGAPSVAGSVARYDNPYLGQQAQRSANVGPNPYGMDNPYLNNAINAASADATKNFNQSVMPQLDRMMAASGSYGNTGVQQMQKDAFDTLGRNLGNISSNMRMQDYTQQQGLAENALNRGQANNQFNSGLSAADLGRNLSGGFQQSAQNNQFGLDAAKFDAGNQLQNQQFNAGLLQGNNQYNAGSC